MGQKVHMIYSEGGYAKIIQTHGFTLEGWPLKVFRLLATISSIYELTTL